MPPLEYNPSPPIPCPPPVLEIRLPQYHSSCRTILSLLETVNKLFNPFYTPPPRVYAVQESGFFKLPIELRLIIYRLVIVERPFTSSGEYERVPPVCGPVSRERWPPHQWLALARTCRQAYDEAVPLVYRSHKFWLGRDEPRDQLQQVRRFLKTVPQTNLLCLTNVWLAFPEVKVNPFVDDDDDGLAEITPDSLTCLKVLRNSCPNVTGVYLLLERSYNERLYRRMEGRYGGRYLRTFQRLLGEIDAELGEFPSLSKVVVLLLGSGLVDRTTNDGAWLDAL